MVDVTVSGVFAGGGVGYEVDGLLRIGEAVETTVLGDIGIGDDAGDGTVGVLGGGGSRG